MSRSRKGSGPPTAEHRANVSTATRQHWAQNPRRRQSGDELLMKRRSVTADGCWEWTGYTNPAGYGVCRVRDVTHYVHRMAHQLWVGPLVDGMQIDHLCRNRRCFNPQHLEQVTPRTNVLRGLSPSALTATTGVCRRGHLMTPENTYTRPDGSRRWCRACAAYRRRQERARKRDAVKASA